MNTSPSRREFLSEVGRGVLLASVGLETATSLGLAESSATAEPAELSFGSLEPLVQLMQETPADRLMGVLTGKLRGGTNLRELLHAGALANARTFGGEDYVGFHTLMALSPAWYMSQELSGATQPLPVLKVLYRNTIRLQEHGGRKNEVLRPVQAATLAAGKSAGEQLREAVHRKDVQAAERTFAAIAKGSVEDTLDQLLTTVHDHTEVHRIVLPYRAWDLMGVIGSEQAHALLRQSVRYCVKAESWSGNARWDEPRTLLPNLLDQHHLPERATGRKTPDDAWVEHFSQTLFKLTAPQAAGAAAEALAEGIAPDAIGEAITLTANQLVLRDLGRTPRDEVAGKPIGSVHGDSIGVHATDSANAWRCLARVGQARNRCACLILGAYQVALDRTSRGGDFQNWQPLPYGWQFEQIRKRTDRDALLTELDEAIRGNLQARAAALVHRYGELDGDASRVFPVLLKYAISEDGSLHAEKYYRTCTEEFRTTRPAFRWRHLISLARVTASEHGRPAAGVGEARSLLGLSGA